MRSWGDGINQILFTILLNIHCLLDTFELKKFKTEQLILIALIEV